MINHGTPGAIKLRQAEARTDLVLEAMAALEKLVGPFW